MEEAWRRFEQSGKVTDYLEFKGLECSQELAGWQVGGKERPDGAESFSDGYGLKCHADRRI